MKKPIALFAIALLLCAGCSAAGSGSAAAAGKAADFELDTAKGGSVSLDELTDGKKAVLVFWATWCPHCRTEAPHVEKFYKENKGNVSVVGVNIGESAAKVSSFTERLNLTYPMALDITNSVANSYGVRGVPTVIAVGEDKTILYFGHSVDEMEKRVEF